MTSSFHAEHPPPVQPGSVSSTRLAVYNVALSLIHQYAVMSMNEKEAEIFRVALDDILHVIPTILNGFEVLTNKRKVQLMVPNILMNLAQTDFQIHNYNTDSDHEIPAPRSLVNSRSGIPSLGACACTNFIETAV